MIKTVKKGQMYANHLVLVKIKDAKNSKIVYDHIAPYVRYFDIKVSKKPFIKWLNDHHYKLMDNGLERFRSNTI